MSPTVPWLLLSSGSEGVRASCGSHGSGGLVGRRARPLEAWALHCGVGRPRFGGSPGPDMLPGSNRRDSATGCPPGETSLGGVNGGLLSALVSSVSHTMAVLANRVVGNTLSSVSRISLPISMMGLGIGVCELSIVTSGRQAFCFIWSSTRNGLCLLSSPPLAASRTRLASGLLDARPA